MIWDHRIRVAPGLPAVTRPGICRWLRHHARPHRVTLDLTVARQEIRFRLHQTCPVAPFPSGARAVVRRVALLHIPTAYGLHDLGETVCLVRGHPQVHMIRHQHIGMHAAVIRRGSGVQTLPVHAVIVRVQADWLAIMPALDDMLGHIHKGGARGSRPG